MFTALKLFFGTPLGRGLMIAAGVVLVLVATYSLGSSHGYASGHTKGVKDGYASRNEEVKHLNDNVVALSKLINDERLAQHEKVKDIEQTAANAAVETQIRLGKQIQARDKIIADYNKVVPISIQEKCGLDLSTVRAINQLIDNVNGEQNEDTERNSGSLGNSVNPAASGMRQQSATEGAIGRRSVSTEGRESEHSGEDTTALQQAASDGGQGVQPEGYADLHRHGVDALQRLHGSSEGRSGKSP